MASDDERRAHQRITLRSLVEVRLPTWEALRGVYTTNLSVGGMRLSFGARLPLGVTIDIILTLPNGQRLHLPGKVANLGPDGTGDVGVKFEGLLPKTQREIERYILEIQEGRDPGQKNMATTIPPGTLIKKT